MENGCAWRAARFLRLVSEWTSEFDSDPDSEARLVPLMEQNFLAGAREQRAQFAVSR